MKLRLFIILGFLFCGINAGLSSLPGEHEARGKQDKGVAFMTYVSNSEQERAVRALVKSIRERAGNYSDCLILVAYTNPDNFKPNSLELPDVELIPLSLGKRILEYPLAVKAFAASEMEKRAGNKIQSLIWFDPGVMVLNPPDALDLKGKYDISVRPVSLSNNISLPPGSAPDDYWTPIYRSNRLDFKKLPPMQTIVDEVDIQPYYNCEVYSVNPALGICREWSKQLDVLLSDREYQDESCTTFTKKLFLHQAVLSGIITSRIKPGRIKDLPVHSGYPFTQHGQLKPRKQVSSLNELSVIIFDYAWARIPSWMRIISVEEPLRGWLVETYSEYLELTSGLYRIEGSCNSYLITTPEGSVLIDPAGASFAPEFFRNIISKNPLRAILLTHAHQDHSDNIAAWKEGRDIPVIAQRKFKEYFDYQEQFAGFFARRNAIWSGKELPAQIEIKPDSRYEPTLFFADDYNYELGGIHFHMIHTPGETPDHTTIWIPEKSSVLAGDNYYEYFINNSTFRGTMIRPIRGYITAIDTALSFNPENFLPGHGEPISGREMIANRVVPFNKALKYIYTETVKGINQGKDIHTLMQEVKLPSDLNVADGFGKVSWTVRGIYQEYVGWFDEKPETMYELPLSSVYHDIAELAGIEPMIVRANKLLAENEFVKVLYLTDIILDYDPASEEASAIRVKALEALKGATYNHIEKIWLNHAFGTAEKRQH